MINKIGIVKFQILFVVYEFLIGSLTTSLDKLSCFIIMSIAMLLKIYVIIEIRHTGRLHSFVSILIIKLTDTFFVTLRNWSPILNHRTRKLSQIAEEWKKCKYDCFSPFTIAILAKQLYTLRFEADQVMGVVFESNTTCNHIYQITKYKCGKLPQHNLLPTDQI